ncbi:hypothetical protein [Micromonospora sp. WMMC273]|uniref:hypothetical protein n=1 Tax=Micromonospora sp. WMMC273 TaxID=3015157 RepID=UPI0022B6D475|nr:hypothetical protein [Micromonospora sp. WMMC273]MCZ7478916.1 hypothetical protein [Micromonospora sp. WMMC273]
MNLSPLLKMSPLTRVMVTVLLLAAAGGGLWLSAVLGPERTGWLIALLVLLLIGSTYELIRRLRRS